MINYLISENKLINLFEYPFTRPCGAGKSVENLQKARLELQKNMSQRVVLPDNRVITYQIDARGRRIGKKIDNVFVYGFIYGDQLNPIAKVDESGNIIESYIYGLKSNIPEYLIKDGKKYKIISNHLGSPIMVLGGQAQDLPVLQMKYDSFGNIIEENGSFEIPFRFAGGIWDKDTKLTRFGVRDYDSETGRWTSKEPLGFDGARNFYVYVGNDPIMLWDLTGLFPDLFKYHRTYGNWLGGKIFEVKQKVVKLAQKTWNNVPCEAKSMAKDFLGLNDDSDDTAVITGDNLIIPHKKLAHEYEHAPHFGINGNWNKINAKAFEDALRLHIDNPLSLPFQGTYRGTIYVTHYFNPTNNNNIMVD